jgi:hypothetical protein
MRLSGLRMVRALLAGLALFCLAGHTASTASVVPALPNPLLYLTGQEAYTNDGKDYVRYRFAVLNSGDYPAEMFAAAPRLPPCGKNTSASRTWVDLYDQSGKRLNGFCALGKPDDLNQLWFALEQNALPPSWVYVELNDRATNTKYKSNIAETTP